MCKNEKKNKKLDTFVNNYPITRIQMPCVKIIYISQTKCTIIQRQVLLLVLK